MTARDAELLQRLRESPVLRSVVFSFECSRDAHRNIAHTHASAGLDTTTSAQFVDAFEALIELLGGERG